MSENFATFESRESSKRTCVEPGVLESKTTIHTVCSQLKSLLLNIVLKKIAETLLVDASSGEHIPGAFLRAVQFGLS